MYGYEILHFASRDDGDGPYCFEGHLSNFKVMGTKRVSIYL